MNSNLLLMRLLLPLLVLASGSFAGAVNQSDRRPNIILILADDLGASDLSCTGSSFYQTPNIDRLASKSVRFERAYASPTCSPSRSAILSGKNPARLGIVGHGGIMSMTGGGDFLRGDTFTLAEALQSGGYATCHIGKWHVATAPSGRPQRQGFEEVIGANEFCCPGSYFYPYRDAMKPPKQAARSAIPDLSQHDPSEHLSEALAREAAAYIAGMKDSDRPFFLNLWHYAVHTPIQANRAKVEKYSQLKKPGSRQNNPGYAGLVEHLDESVGRVLEALEVNGFSENTIVIFFSDNGGEVRREVTSNYPLRSGKATLYEGGIRVPLFIRWPGVAPEGASCQTPVVGHDLYPTILTMAGAENVKGEPIDGLDISGLIRNPQSVLPKRALHWLRYGEVVHYKGYRMSPTHGPCSAILSGDWKLIEHYPTPAGRAHRIELYRLDRDPSEEFNLADDHPNKTAELRSEMDRWRKEIDMPSYRQLAWPAFEKQEQRLRK